MSASRSAGSLFIAEQRQAQGEFFQTTITGHSGYRGSIYRLAPDQLALNLAPSLGAVAAAYFMTKQIAWHIHATHGLSSQICCLNFLMPLAMRPDILSRLTGGALGIEPPEMLEVERGPGGEAWYVGFEWIGASNYLGEWPRNGPPTRGAQVTSADAIVRFQHHGRVETLLIEWKYAEEYGSPIRRHDDPKSLEIRKRCYADRVFAPAGPIRNDLGLELEHFYWEPFYQMMRQQTLAACMQRDHEDGAERVRLLEISPGGNRALHKVTAPALRSFGRRVYDDAFESFAATLVRPEDFISRTTEQIFGPVLRESPDDPWAAYLLKRYRFLTVGAA